MAPFIPFWYKMTSILSLSNHLNILPQLKDNTKLLELLHAQRYLFSSLYTIISYINQISELPAEIVGASKYLFGADYLKEELNRHGQTLSDQRHLRFEAECQKIPKSLHVYFHISPDYIPRIREGLHIPTTATATGFVIATIFRGELQYIHCHFCSEKSLTQDGLSIAILGPESYQILCQNPASIIDTCFNSVYPSSSCDSLRLLGAILEGGSLLDTRWDLFAKESPKQLWKKINRYHPNEVYNAFVISYIFQSIGQTEEAATFFKQALTESDTELRSWWNDAAVFITYNKLSFDEFLTFSQVISFLEQGSSDIVSIDTLQIPFSAIFSQFAQLRSELVYRWFRHSVNDFPMTQFLADVAQGSNDRVLRQVPHALKACGGPLRQFVVNVLQRFELTLTENELEWIKTLLEHPQHQNLGARMLVMLADQVELKKKYVLPSLNSDVGLGLRLLEQVQEHCTLSEMVNFMNECRQKTLLHHSVSRSQRWRGLISTLFAQHEVINLEHASQARTLTDADTTVFTDVPKPTLRQKPKTIRKQAGLSENHELVLKSFERELKDWVQKGLRLVEKKGDKKEAEEVIRQLVTMPDSPRSPLVSLLLKYEFTNNKWWEIALETCSQEALVQAIATLGDHAQIWKRVFQHKDIVTVLQNPSKSVKSRAPVLIRNYLQSDTSGPIGWHLLALVDPAGSKERFDLTVQLVERLIPTFGHADFTQAEKVLKAVRSYNKDDHASSSFVSIIKAVSACKNPHWNALCVTHLHACKNIAIQDALVGCLAALPPISETTIACAIDLAQAVIDRKGWDGMCDLFKPLVMKRDPDQQEKNSQILKDSQLFALFQRNYANFFKQAAVDPSRTRFCLDVDTALSWNHLQTTTQDVRKEILDFDRQFINLYITEFTQYGFDDVTLSHFAAFIMRTFQDVMHDVQNPPAGVDMSLYDLERFEAIGVSSLTCRYYQFDDDVAFPVLVASVLTGFTHRLPSELKFIKMIWCMIDLALEKVPATDNVKAKERLLDFIAQNLRNIIELYPDENEIFARIRPFIHAVPPSDKLFKKHRPIVLEILRNLYRHFHHRYGEVCELVTCIQIEPRTLRQQSICNFVEMHEKVKTHLKTKKITLIEFIKLLRYVSVYQIYDLITLFDERQAVVNGIYEIYKNLSLTKLQQEAVLKEFSTMLFPNVLLFGMDYETVGIEAAKKSAEHHMQFLLDCYIKKNEYHYLQDLCAFIYRLKLSRVFDTEYHRLEQAALGIARKTFDAKVKVNEHLFHLVGALTSVIAYRLPGRFNIESKIALLQEFFAKLTTDSYKEQFLKNIVVMKIVPCWPQSHIAVLLKWLESINDHEVLSQITAQLKTLSYFSEICEQLPLTIKTELLADQFLELNLTLQDQNFR